MARKILLWSHVIILFSQAKDLLKSETYSTTALMNIVIELRDNTEEVLQ